MNTQDHETHQAYDKDYGGVGFKHGCFSLPP